MFCYDDTLLSFAEHIPFVCNVPGVFFCLTSKAKGREGRKKILSDIHRLFNETKSAGGNAKARLVCSKAL